jgi:ferredoxin-type protein NapF
MKRGYLRWLVRCLAFAAAVFCAWPGMQPVFRAGLVPRLSPFAAALALASRAVDILLLLAFPVAVAAVFSPRFFCRWLCPAGLCRDCVQLGRKSWGWQTRLPQFGVWVAAIGLGAAAIGFPLFLCLDPLVLFNAAFGLLRPERLSLTDRLACIGPAALLLSFALFPNLWCAKLCPLGATQDFLFALRKGLRAFASRGKGTGAAPAGGLGRRAFIGLGLGAGYRLMLDPRKRPPPRAIRPPGTGDEAVFLRRCSRCGACARACPAGIIEFGGTSDGVAGFLAPRLNFERDYCQPACDACGRVCPTGAIRRFRLQDKHSPPLGIAEVDAGNCLSAQGRECGTCVNACPHGALDTNWDAKEQVNRVVVDADVCTGCGCCEYVCPAEPKAIRVRARAQTARYAKHNEGNGM